MKKLFLITIILALGVTRFYGELPPQGIYLIGTSIRGVEEKVTGFKMLEEDTSPLYLTPQVTFIIRSIPQNFEIWLGHFNYNPVELAKTRPPMPWDTMLNKVYGIGYLTTYMRCIDVNALAMTKTQAEAWSWAESIRGQRIFIIDRNDFFKSHPALQEPDKMRVIEVKLMRTNRPEPADYEVKQ